MQEPTDAELAELGIDRDTWRELAPIIEAEERRKQETRDRHAREAAAMAGVRMQISREAIRQARRVMEAAERDPERFGFLAERLKNGSGMGVARAYRFVTGDKRRAIYARLPADVWHALEDDARKTGELKADLLETILREHYGLTQISG